MQDLFVGDIVKIGPSQYSRVFMFTHQLTATTAIFVTLFTASGAHLSFTAGHNIYANGTLVPANTVKAGDLLTLGNGDTTAVVSVASVDGAAGKRLKPLQYLYCERRRGS